MKEKTGRPGGLSSSTEPQSVSALRASIPDAVQEAVEFGNQVIGELEAFAPLFHHTSLERAHLDRALLALYGFRRAVTSCRCAREQP